VKGNRCSLLEENPSRSVAADIPMAMCRLSADRRKIKMTDKRNRFALRSVWYLESSG
jgi:hypothetical protein